MRVSSYKPKSREGGEERIENYQFYIWALNRCFLFAFCDARIAMSRRCNLREAVSLLVFAATIATAERLVVLEETRVETFLTGVETTSGTDTVEVNLEPFELKGSLPPRPTVPPTPNPNPTLTPPYKLE